MEFSIQKQGCDYTVIRIKNNKKVILEDFFNYSKLFLQVIRNKFRVILELPFLQNFKYSLTEVV